MDRLGRSRFALYVCDSTGNTRASRRLTVDEVPTILRAADIAHHGSNTIKNLVKLDYFSETIKTIRHTITFFHHSHEGSHNLKLAREAESVARGLQSIGKTRFATIVLSSRSVHRNYDAIKLLVETRKIPKFTVRRVIAGSISQI